MLLSCNISKHQKTFFSKHQTSVEITEFSPDIFFVLVSLSLKCGQSLFEFVFAITVTSD